MVFCRLIISLLTFVLLAVNCIGLAVPKESENKLLHELTLVGVQTINGELSKGYDEFQMNDYDKPDKKLEEELQNRLQTLQERDVTRTFILEKLSKIFEELKNANRTCYDSILNIYRNGCISCLIERCDRKYEQLGCQDETGMSLAKFNRVLRRSLTEDIARVAEETASAWLRPIDLEQVTDLIENYKITYQDTREFLANSSEILFEFTNKFRDGWTDTIANIENLIELGDTVTDDVSNWFNATNSRLEEFWTKQAETFSRRIESWWNNSQLEIEQTGLEESAFTFIDSIFETTKDIFTNLVQSFTSSLWDNQESQIIEEIEEGRSSMIRKRRSVTQKVDQFVCENLLQTCPSHYTKYCNSECANERFLQNCTDIIDTQRQLNRVLEDTKGAISRFDGAVQDFKDYVQQLGKKYEWIIDVLNLPQSQRAYKVLQIDGEGQQNPKITVVMFGEEPFTFELEEPLENKLDVENLGSRIALNSLDEYSTKKLSKMFR